MKNEKPLKKLIPEFINDYIEYEPITGNMRRKIITNKTQSVNINHVNYNGYLEFRLFVTKYTAHRVAWFIMTGQQPNIIDHINGDRLDNRFCNLRNGDLVQNSRNLSKHRAGNHLGVYYSRGKRLWIVQLPKEFSICGTKQVFGGNFKSKEEAAKKATSMINNIKEERLVRQAKKKSVK